MCTKLELTKAQIGTFIGLTTQELLENVISSLKLMQQTIIAKTRLRFGQEFEKCVSLGQMAINREKLVI